MIWIEEENMKDRLQEIWERQKNFDNIVFANAGVTREQVANEIKVALITEIGELYNENPTFKFWKEQKNIEITDKTKEEFVDCLHFLISLGQDIFKDEQEMFDWYCKKNDKNLLRQKTGY
ncbi:dUTP diphosphatase [Fusobacterium gonidiaformans 3-1-5R]|uniref:dUTP diphosphatase n=2 Tax=Fusobacterium TaxID=848 RepID=E5BHY9_9FUSO|nr:dUTP diphosphatase [Fusobacterium gonidiaformans 3-1-5R]